MNLLLPVPSPPRHVPDTAALGAALRRLRPWGDDGLMTVVERLAVWRRGSPLAFEALADPLSPWLSEERRHPPLARRSYLEAPAASHVTDVTAIFFGGGAVAATLGELHRSSRAGDGALRRCEIASDAGAHGEVVRFPAPERLASLLERIARECARLVWTEPLFAAVVAMVQVAAAHPFTDGNGRVSRILFNAMASQAGEAAGYLPIYELGLMSQGGWLLALRRAQVEGDWTAIVDWLAVGADITADLQAAGARQPRHRHPVTTELMRVNHRGETHASVD